MSLVSGLLIDKRVKNMSCSKALRDCFVYDQNTLAFACYWLCCNSISYFLFTKYYWTLFIIIIDRQASPTTTIVKSSYSGNRKQDSGKHLK